MVAQTIFYNETTINGKVRILSQVELPLKCYGGNAIHEHENQLYKNLSTYWATKKQLEKLQNDFTLTRTSFGFFDC